MPIPATARLVEFPGGAALAGPLSARAESQPVAARSPDEAYAAGRADGLAEGRFAAEGEAAEALRAALETASAASEQRLAAERAAWAKDEGASLAAQLAAGLSSLEETLGAEVAAILAPFVDAALRERTLDALRDTLAPLVAGGAGPLLRVSGPADLVDALRGRLGPHADALVVDAGASPEIRVVADRTTVETRLAAWGECLRGESA